MSLLDDLITRFRRIASPPGAPAATAVPLDETAARTAEVAHIFAALDAVEAECTAVHRDAEVEAELIRSRAAGEAETVRAEAAAHAETIRAASRAEALRAVDELDAEGERAATAAVERLRHAVAAWLPGGVERALEAIRATGAPPLP